MGKDAILALFLICHRDRSQFVLGFIENLHNGVGMLRLP